MTPEETLFQTLLNFTLSVNGLGLSNLDPPADPTDANAVLQHDVATKFKDYFENFAAAIMAALGDGSGGSSGGVLSDYVKKSGGAYAVMQGSFTALHGIRAGSDNQPTFWTEGTVAGDDLKTRFVRPAHFDSTIYGMDNLFADFSGGKITINGNNDFSGGVDFHESFLQTTRAIQIGLTSADGLLVYNDPLDSADDIFTYKDFNIYHAGNSNLFTVDWSMKNGYVDEDLHIGGDVTAGGTASFLYGFEAGTQGVQRFATTDDGVYINGNASLEVNCGIKAVGIDYSDPSSIKTNYILRANAAGNTFLDASGNILVLGFENTKHIELHSELLSSNGNKLINHLGEAWFKWGFTGGIDEVTTFETISRGAASANKGTRFYNFVELANDTEPNKIVKLFTNPSSHLEALINGKNISIGHGDDGMEFDTDDTQFLFKKPLLGVPMVGVLRSDGTVQTKMEDGQVHVGVSSLGVPHYFRNIEDGIKHFGNAYFDGNLGSEVFSSGFSGEGWRLDKDEAKLTLDELIVRRKMRVYELEVQKISATNGALWVSSGTSADEVEEIF